jgi:aryl-alcohol dehydrogenase-like predicted oxidoreductase
VHRRQLGTSMSVSAVGIGCMGMSFAYGGQDEQQAIRTLRRAVDAGVNFFDTAEVYGPYENEILVGKALRPVRNQVVIATKFGFKISPTEQGSSCMIGLDGRLENAKAVAHASLRRLGIDVIDLYYLHRIDPEIPVEETIGAMADLVKDGCVRMIGMSEPSAASLKRAHATYPITAVQSEFSLWPRDAEQDILSLCKDLNIGFVAFCPLGRGFLTGGIGTAPRWVKVISASICRGLRKATSIATWCSPTGLQSLRKRRDAPRPSWRSPGSFTKADTSCQFPAFANSSTLKRMPVRPR